MSTCHVLVVITLQDKRTYRARWRVIDLNDRVESNVVELDAGFSYTRQDMRNATHLEIIINFIFLNRLQALSM